MIDLVLSLREDWLGPGATVDLPGCTRVLYAVEGGVAVAPGDEGTGTSLEANAAWFATGAVRLRAGPGGARVWCWELTRPGVDGGAGLLSARVGLDPAQDWLLRCDRVDFPMGGVAWTHTHPGPGIRCLLRGAIEIRSGGAVHAYGPGQARFERGPDPVLALASAEAPTSFVRGMLLPVALRGRSSIRYLDLADADKPKPQQYTRFVDEPVDLARLA